MIKIQNWTILFIVILLLLVGGLVWHINGVKSQRNSALEALEVANTESLSFRDEVGHWRNIAKVQAMDKKTLKALHDANEKNIKRITETFDIKIKQLQSSQSIQTVSTLSVKGNLTDTVREIVVRDSIIYTPIRSFDFTDQWKQVSCYIENDSIKIDVIVKDSLEAVIYWNKKWFLGKKHFTGEIISKNPDTEIVDQQVIIQKDRRRFLGIF